LPEPITVEKTSELEERREMRRCSRCTLAVLVLLVVPPSLGCGPRTDDVADTGTAETSTDSTDSDAEADTEGGVECAGERCNPLSNDCPEGELCIFFNTEFQCFPSTGDGSGVAGAFCDTATACNEGLACIQSVFFANCEGDACCSPNCDLDEPNTCPNAAAGETCMQWFVGQEGTDPCYANVGVCGTL
jgi:hypothetical protein